MLKLQITIDGDPNYGLNLSAENMKELIDVKLPAWIPTLEEDLPALMHTKRFKSDPVKAEKEERESGWYYDA